MPFISKNSISSSYLNADNAFCFGFPGDELLEVNGESLQGLTHQEAIQTFKVGRLMSFKTLKSSEPA